MEVQFDWCNNGKPFTLKEMPLAGSRCLNELKRRAAPLLAAQANGQSLMLAQALVATKRILESKGVEDAKASLDEFAPTIFDQGLVQQLNWSLDDFEHQLMVWMDKIVYRAHNITPISSDFKEEHAHLTQQLLVRGKELQEGIEALEYNAEDFQYDLILTEIYWRLRGHIDVVHTADGDESIDWGLEAGMPKKSALELLSEVSTLGDFRNLRLGMEVVKDDSPLSMEDISPTTTEAVVKKS